ncbi:MAG: NAD(P)-dependent oxidoreductase, partial [Nitrospiria bacterium]
WTGWSPTQLLGLDLRDATLGIVGMGRIGRAVGLRARGFGMRVLYASRSEPRDIDPAWRRASLAELLSEADVVSLHVPLTSETHHLIGARELAALKPTAYLINTARGAVVDEAALAEALRHGTLAGAGLDVYEHEPVIHPELRASDKTVILPHLGSATEGTRERMGTMVMENLLAVLEERAPPNPVEG